MKLKQIQYRSFKHDITLHHFQAWYLPVRNFCLTLNRQEHGYVDTLLSYDPIIRLQQSVPDGDEIPKGCMEVAYLYNVFRNGGSALGFRIGNNVVEWVCFDCPIDDLILKKVKIDNPHPDGPQLLFHHVANLPKGTMQRLVKGANLEHKGWYDSLWNAYHRPVKFELTWKNFGNDLKQECRLQRNEHATQEGLEPQMAAMEIDGGGFTDSHTSGLLGDSECREEYERDIDHAYLDQNEEENGEGEVEVDEDEDGTESDL